MTQERLKKLLNLELSPSEYASYDKQRGSAVAEASNALRRFILPVSECEFTLQTALDELRPDPFPREPGMRPFRATGVAIAAAQGLIAECHSAQGARVMVFTSGACTMGPGSIVGRDMSETMRTHQDFNKGSAKHYKAASKFYNQLGIRLATHAHTLDVFACSLDQVGLAEMKTAVDQTGGVMVLAEQFGAEAFRSSLRRMFAQGLLRRPGHVLQRDVLGVLHAARDGVRRHRPHVRARRQEQVHLRERGGHGPDHVVANLLAQLEHLGGGVLRDREPALQPDPSGTPFYLQFCVRYKRSNGEIRLRVMTVARRWAETSSSHDVVSGFDQEAAALLVARVSTFRIEHEETFDLLRWLDRTLIRVGTKFGEYAKDAPETFRMPGPFAIYPQFMFNLRRSQFLQTANNTPDETAFYRLMMGRETVLNSLIMIQPTLMSYTFNGPPMPVLLDVASIQPDCILLLDTFFMIVVHAGSTIAAWRKANYQDQPEHEAFRNLLAQPVADAATAMGGRCPTPRLVECDQGGSQGAVPAGEAQPQRHAQHERRVDAELRPRVGGGGGGYDGAGGGRRSYSRTTSP